MSDIVQKKNAPAEELSHKVTNMEAQIAENEADKEKTDLRIQRLQEINNSMSLMFESEKEKARVESDSKLNALKLEIAKLNTDLSKQKIQMSSASNTVESIEDMKETVKVTEERFEEKVKHILRLQTDIEV